MKALKRIKGIITWKKRIADLVKEAKSVAGFLLPNNFESSDINIV